MKCEYCDKTASYFIRCTYNCNGQYLCGTECGKNARENCQQCDSEHDPEETMVEIDPRFMYRKCVICRRTATLTSYNNDWECACSLFCHEQYELYKQLGMFIARTITLRNRGHLEQELADTLVSRAMLIQAKTKRDQRSEDDNDEDEDEDEDEDDLASEYVAKKRRLEKRKQEVEELRKKLQEAEEDQDRMRVELQTLKKRNKKEKKKHKRVARKQQTKQKTHMLPLIQSSGAYNQLYDNILKYQKRYRITQQRLQGVALNEFATRNFTPNEAIAYLSFIRSYEGPLADQSVEYNTELPSSTRFNKGNMQFEPNLYKEVGLTALSTLFLSEGFTGRPEEDPQKTPMFLSSMFKTAKEQLPYLQNYNMEVYEMLHNMFYNWLAFSPDVNGKGVFRRQISTPPRHFTEMNGSLIKEDLFALARLKWYEANPLAWFESIFLGRYSMDSIYYVPSEIDGIKQKAQNPMNTLSKYIQAGCCFVEKKENGKKYSIDSFKTRVVTIVYPEADRLFSTEEEALEFESSDEYISMIASFQAQLPPMSQSSSSSSSSSSGSVGSLRKLYLPSDSSYISSNISTIPYKHYDLLTVEVQKKVQERIESGESNVSQRFEPEHGMYRRDTRILEKQFQFVLKLYMELVQQLKMRYPSQFLYRLSEHRPSSRSPLTIKPEYIGNKYFDQFGIELVNNRLEEYLKLQQVQDAYDTREFQEYQLMDLEETLALPLFNVRQRLAESVELATEYMTTEKIPFGSEWEPRLFTNDPTLYAYQLIASYFVSKKLEGKNMDNSSLFTRTNYGIQEHVSLEYVNSIDSLDKLVDIIDNDVWRQIPRFSHTDILFDDMRYFTQYTSQTTMKVYDELPALPSYCTLLQDKILSMIDELQGQIDTTIKENMVFQLLGLKVFEVYLRCAHFYYEKTGSFLNEAAYLFTEQFVNNIIRHSTDPITFIFPDNIIDSDSDFKLFENTRLRLRQFFAGVDPTTIMNEFITHHAFIDEMIRLEMDARVWDSELDELDLDAEFFAQFDNITELEVGKMQKYGKGLNSVLLQRWWDELEGMFFTFKPGTFVFEISMNHFQELTDRQKEALLERQ